MNTYRRRFLGALLLASLWLPAWPCSASERVPAKDRIVVVISIDGFPGWEWDDSRLPVPNLWQLARDGVRAQTVTITNPTVTWPTHTSMVTGVRAARHGVLFNGLPVRHGERAPLTIKPWHDKEDLVRAPTVYDLVHEAGFTTAEVNWVAIHKARRITWRFPEVPDPEGAIEREMIKAGIISETDVKEFFKSSPAWRDYYWTQAGVHIIREHKPNLLLFHLLNTDALNHMDGPKTWSSRTGYAFADECVGRILGALKAAGVWDRATVLVVTDHGFKTAKRFVRPNAILRQMNLLEVAGGKIASCDAHAIPAGGTAMVYFTSSEKKQQLAGKCGAVFRATEGVERVLTPNEFAAWDLPHPSKSERVADLVLVAKEGYAFTASHELPEIASGREAGYPGHHGYPASDPAMNGIFIARGYGIRTGARIETMSHVDVGPTIAALFGLEMKDVEGRVLRQILDDELTK